MPQKTRRLYFSLFLGLAAIFFANTAWAQSALERLEQQIRQRNSSSANANRSAETSNPRNRTSGNDSNAELVYLGLVADDQNDRGRGVRVLAIHPGGPAEKAGIRNQDLITAMTGTRIRQMSDLSDILETFTPGQTISVDLIRDGKKHAVKLVLGRRPAVAKAASPTTFPATREPSGNAGSSQDPALVIPTPPAEQLPELPEQLAGPLLMAPKIPITASQTSPPAPSLPETLEQPANPTLESSKTVEPPKDASQRIDQLQRRIEALERRIAELEKALAESKKSR
jgi:hypothetical protein